MLVALVGCSGDDEGSKKDAAPTSSGETASAVETDARLGVVKGRLGKKRSQGVLTAVTAVVERWFDRGYGGDYPRGDFGAAFGEFTKDARALAVRQSGVTSNAKVGPKLEGVEMVRRAIRVDVAAPNGRPAGATARVRLKFTMSGGVERTDLVTGRLLLTPTEDGWKVFGFDLRRGEEAP
ncbi:hypothetical protein [Nocardioides vastitatis]|uniref:Nuclear transport factor 2 family protein n=2 Tax=Nocardioides TaxID=1839 RepID=A0ABW0ZB86_9ACTN|nr:hypothetical protein E7Z54_00625 [Nocardioides sp.]